MNTTKKIALLTAAFLMTAGSTAAMAAPNGPAPKAPQQHQMQMAQYDRHDNDRHDNDRHDTKARPNDFRFGYDQRKFRDRFHKPPVKFEKTFKAPHHGMKYRQGHWQWQKNHWAWIVGTWFFVR